MSLPNFSNDVYQELEARGKKQWPKAAKLGASMLLCMFFFALGRYSLPKRDATPASEAAAGIGSSNETSNNGTFHLWTTKLLPIYRHEPLAKNVIRLFDDYLMHGATFDNGDAKLRNVGQWLAQDFKYDTVGFPGSDTLEGWCLGGEEKEYRRAFPTSGFTQMLFFGDDEHATTTSYGVALWNASLFGIPEPENRWTYFRVIDFYHLRKYSDTHGLVDYNFMMMDFADLFRRVGRPVLPPATLPEGLVCPPAANDGVPAPFSVMVAGRDSASAKKAAKGAMEDVWLGDSLPEKWWHSDLTFYGPGGIGTARGAKQFYEHVIQPYHAAFANRSLESKMLFCEANYCGAFGVLHGRHVGTWVGQAASYATLGVRYSMHFRIVDGKIKEGWAIFDFPGLFEQLGLNFWAIARNQNSKFDSMDTKSWV